MSFIYCDKNKDCTFKRLIMTEDKKVCKGVICVGNKKKCGEEIKYKNTNASGMFEDMGYTRKEDNKMKLITYTKRDKMSEQSYTEKITFLGIGESVLATRKWDCEEESTLMELNVKQIEAINKQVKELGWGLNND